MNFKLEDVKLRSFLKNVCVSQIDKYLLVAHLQMFTRNHRWLTIHTQRYRHRLKTAWKMCLHHKGSPQQVVWRVLIWLLVTSDALPDATPKGFGSPPRIKPASFHFLGKCVNYNSVESHNLAECLTEQISLADWADKFICGLCMRHSDRKMNYIFLS